MKPPIRSLEKQNLWKNLLYAIVSLGYWILIGLFTLLLILPLWIWNLIRPSRVLSGKVIWLWSRIIRWFLPIRVIVVDEQKREPEDVYILIATQASHAETLIFPSVLPSDLIWVINKEYARIPVFGWARKPNCIVIDRNQKKAALKKLLRMAPKFLEKGISVGISPEGFRSKNGKLQPFQNGPFVLAEKSKVKLLPVIAIGMEKILPYGSWIIRPGTVKILFKQFILPENFSSSKELQEYSHRFFSKVISENLTSPG
ncbi:lysophospholipid acyltransferase family protein [Leptospira perolatii]|uniref:lysophospholipid acyltransferase family protein n=1 Tax=Leptospira perolatii TaxID=2023191 RepID=UPI0013FE18A9|nr:lysophospholipid acyltransferase family protein [Leptospira perolatii]